MVGRYKLCWCRPTSSENCTSVVNDEANVEFHGFRASAGELLVNGPAPGQNFICTKGLPCTIEITGVNLEGEDRIMALANCGEGTVTDGPIEGFPSSIATVVDAANQTYTWGTGQVDASAGLYYACWCSGRFTCDQDPLNFRAEVELSAIGNSTPVACVGIISVNGPDESNLVCVLGLECSQTVSGVGLHEARAARPQHK
eukprot:472857-Amphidinium_carterae.1